MLKINPLSRRRFIASAAAALPLATTHAQTPSPKGAPMTSLTTYLLFDGSCREAMEFYHSVLGGELSLTKVSESPAKDHMPAFQQDKILNARLQSPGLSISASDWLRPSQTPVRGNTVCLYLSGGGSSAIKELYDKLADGAELTDPFQQQFFGYYGALNDKFGIRWMFHADAQQG
jgi:PhnB protein